MSQVHEIHFQKCSTRGERCSRFLACCLFFLCWSRKEAQPLQRFAGYSCLSLLSVHGPTLRPRWTKTHLPFSSSQNTKLTLVFNLPSSVASSDQCYGTSPDRGCGRGTQQWQCQCYDPGALRASGALSTICVYISSGLSKVRKGSNVHSSPRSQGPQVRSR